MTVGLNFYFICTIQTQLQSNTVIIEYKHYTNGIQEKKSEDLFESVSQTCAIIQCTLMFVIVIISVKNL